jgi:hypothetical protein
MVTDAGCEVITGAVHAAATVTVAAWLFCEPQELKTLTQNEVVAVRAPVLSAADVAPKTGCVTLGGVPRYHWYSRFVPLAVTLRMALWPDCTLAGCGSVVIDGSTQGSSTVTVAVLLFLDPQEFVTFTQYEVVEVSEPVPSEEDVAPPIGCDSFPLEPRYHWKEVAPEALTLSVVDCPEVIVVDCGCAVMVGSGQEAETVTVALFEVALPQEFVTTTL